VIEAERVFGLRAVRVESCSAAQPSFRVEEFSGVNCSEASVYFGRRYVIFTYRCGDGVRWCLLSVTFSLGNRDD